MEAERLGFKDFKLIGEDDFGYVYKCTYLSKKNALIQNYFSPADRCVRISKEPSL
jgi:hypothetical protein